MSIDKIIIENFKIFEGQHVFDLKDLNIFTGANNSGKSTLIKAISLFSKGLKNGDFPLLDLFDKNAGEFNNLVNKKSGSNNFKIGYFIELFSDKLFKVLFKFIEDSGNAVNSEIKVVNEEGETLLALYDTFLMNTTYSEEGYFNYLANSFDEAPNDSKIIFTSPAVDDISPSLTIRINLNLIKQLCNEKDGDDYTELFDHLFSIKAKDNFWWVECFDEQGFDIYESDLSFLEFEDVIKELENDSLLNLGDIELRNSVFFDRKGIEKEINNYQNLLNGLKYLPFIRNVFKPIFESVKKGLSIFRSVNFAHIYFEEFKTRLVSRSSDSEYLFTLFPLTVRSDDPSDFFRSSLEMFDIDGFVEFRSIKNSTLEVNLVTALKETDKKSKKQTSPRFFIDYKNDYKENPRQNLCDLGKGTANIVTLILKIYSAYYEYEKHKWKNERVRKALGYVPHLVRQKLILIEEPESFIHPDWQSKLADFFIFFTDFSKDFNIKLIIETHSVYLIQRLQYLVAKGNITTDRLNVLFFNPETEKEKFFEMEMRKDGIFKNKFGPGFYDETAKLTIDILDAQSEN